MAITVIGLPMAHMWKNNMYRLFLLVILSIFTCLSSYSQAEGWQVYASYNAPVQLQAAGDYLYVITKGSGTYNSRTGNLVRYDTTDGSVKTYDCLHELNDKEIEHISYNEATERLIIVYASGNIDLLDADDGVLNISALKDNTILGASISCISHVGITAYLCTDTEIIEVDCSEGIVCETYRSVSGKPRSVVGLDGRLYVATTTGLFIFPATANMHDRELWANPATKDAYSWLTVFDNQLISTKAWGVYRLSTDGTATAALYGDISYAVNAHRRLIIGKGGKMYVWEDKFTIPCECISVEHDKNLLGITYVNGRYYIAEDIDGLNSYTLKDASFQDPSMVFAINSPRRDLFYHMHYVGDRLLVAGGINTQLASYYTATFMYMEEDGTSARWTLFDEKAVSANYPKLSNYNSVDLVQDPMDADHFYGAVYRNGLHEYRRGEGEEMELVKVHNYENSPLACIDVPTSSPWNYCTCTALQYDKHGNLWMANQQTDTIVRILRPNGKWVALYYSDIVGAENVFQYLLSSHDINFLVSYEGGPRGFFGFDTNGTLNLTEDDRHLLRSSITNQDETTVNPTQFYCMAEDREQQIWCGCNEGLFVITNPREWFDDTFRFHQIKRSRNDGSGFADYLLAGVDVTCIAVDPSNRKWIGTMSNGVYLVSHDGQETIHHFTKDNSPLLSDRIHSIAVNPKNGRVMFGTDVGLCSYEAEVIEPEETLEEDNILVYPNPVRPSTNAMVTIQGLTEGAEVKILSSSGNAVWGGRSLGGSIRWNCCNMRGDRVPSGVYHVVCNTADAGRTVVTRIVVLR